jgi:hypothetical protein
MVGLNASIKGKDGFKVLNLKSFESDVFYGTAFAGGDLQMTGDFENIVVTGNLNSKKGTKITIPMDSGKKIDLKQEGIPFLKKAEKVDSTLLQKSKKPKIKTGGVKLAFNLSFTPDAECEIIFDRTNNDVLNVFGEGRLSILYDTRGDFTINGPYVVRSGKYNFSFQNLASLRKFNIVDGSRITLADFCIAHHVPDDEFSHHGFLGVCLGGCVCVTMRLHRLVVNAVFSADSDADG